MIEIAMDARLRRARCAIRPWSDAREAAGDESVDYVLDLGVGGASCITMTCARWVPFAV